jgi:uncharacterized protein with von Willebrand factor type A (vWA) domain
VEQIADFTQDIPLEWLRKNLELQLSPEELAKIAKNGLGRANGNAQKALRRSKKSATKAAASGSAPVAPRPLALSGNNPQGDPHRATDSSRNKSAVKVWDQRGLQRTTTTAQELGTRNIKVAPAPPAPDSPAKAHEDELDLDDTICKTAANAGYLDITMRPERHNNVKVLLLMDVGGTMDEHVARVEELFSAQQSRVQAPGVLLLPQLRLRLHVEKQPPPLC